MAPLAVLSLLFLLGHGALASPVVINQGSITLPLSKKINMTGITNLLQSDQARAKALREHGTATAQAKLTGRAAPVSFPVTNVAVVYQASVGVGSPATQYTLLIDTGSSNTWVGATQAYVKTGTSTRTNNRVSVTYGSGSFSGTEFTDQVTLASGLVISKQSIGVASKSQGFQGFDGILGIGPVDLTSGTLSPATTQLIPTVTDNLFSAGTIPQNLIGVSFNPTTAASTTNGELTFGGTDSTKFTGPLSFAPITKTSPASEFWGIDQSISYGTSTILSKTAGIVDTGTTLVLIASDALASYQSATGAVLDNTTGLLKVTQTQFNNMKSLFFNVNGVSFELTPNAQLWPRALNADIGGNANTIYLIVGDIGTNSGSGLDFINGFTFLERFYSVFDTANKQVGFATTASTFATTN